MKKKGLSSAFMASALMTMTGCANVEVQRVSDFYQPGVRYWRPAPYLALAPTSAGGTTTCEAKIVMLPDKREEYAITMNSGLWGSTTANPSLQDGWNLTSLDAKADSKTAETLTAFAAALKAASPVAGITSASGRVSAPRGISCRGLYRAEYDGSGRVSGFTPVSGLVISIPGGQKNGKKKNEPPPKECGKGTLPPCDK